MHNYNIFWWITFFFVYCFLGWCIESTIVSIKSKKLVNRGFLKIPFLPIYGTGAIIILFVCLPFKENILMVYLAGMISATILEYVVGYGMEAIFKMKYWDYSNDKFNYKGRICLVSSLFWGMLAVLLVEFVHKYIEITIFSINENVLKSLVTFIFIIVIIDTIVSTREAIDLNKVLKNMSLLRKEMENIKLEIEEILKIGYEDFSEIKVRGALEAKELLSATKEKIEMLKEKLSDIAEIRKEEISKINTVKTRLIKNNPNVYSPQFNDALKEIKDRLLNKYEEKKNDFIERIGEFQRKIEEFIKEL